MKLLFYVGFFVIIFDRIMHCSEVKNTNSNVDIVNSETVVLSNQKFEGYNPTGVIPESISFLKTKNSTGLQKNGVVDRRQSVIHMLSQAELEKCNDVDNDEKKVDLPGPIVEQHVLKKFVVERMSGVNGFCRMSKSETTGNLVDLDDNSDKILSKQDAVKSVQKIVEVVD